MTPVRPAQFSHRATAAFWQCYAKQSLAIQSAADKAFDLLKKDPGHPSLHFKPIGGLWSARVTLSVRALGVAKENAIVWFWIGSHAEYDRLVEKR